MAECVLYALSVMPATRKELILASIVMLAIPIAAELLLRATHAEFDSQLYIADSDRGWALRPGAKGLVLDETKQFVRINSRGLRDREHSLIKPANTVRIAVLGNSWTEAMQVPLDKTFCSLLERRLTESSCFGDRHVEVINFGVSGYSTAQELITLRDVVRPYRPDLVIVAFYSARDVANNVRRFNNASNPDQAPYFIHRGGKLVLDDSFKNLPAVQNRQIQLQKLRGWLSEHIRALQAVNAMVRYSRAHIALAAAKQEASKTGVYNLEHFIYAEPSQPALKEAWQITEETLLLIRNETTAQGAGMRIVTLPNRPQVIPDPAKRLEFMQSLGVSELSYADTRIDAFGEREGIRVTNLAPALSSYAEKYRVFLNGFDEASFGSGHWNETGHRLAAESIASGMCSSVTTVLEAKLGAH